MKKWMLFVFCALAILIVSIRITSSQAPKTSEDFEQSIATTTAPQLDSIILAPASTPIAGEKITSIPTTAPSGLPTGEAAAKPTTVPVTEPSPPTTPVIDPAVLPAPEETPEPTEVPTGPSGNLCEPDSDF